MRVMALRFPSNTPPVTLVIADRGGWQRAVDRLDRLPTPDYQPPFTIASLRR